MKIKHIKIGPDINSLPSFLGEKIWGCPYNQKISDAFVKKIYFTTLERYHCDFSPAIISAKEISWILNDHDFATVEK